MRRGTAAMALALAGAALAAPARAMPNFARKYGMACTACHSTIPRLNEFGYEFRRAGYRLPTEIGTEAEMKFENTFAARIQPVLNYVRHNDGVITTETAQLTFQEVTLYPLSAAFGKYFSSLTELSLLSEDFMEIENAYVRYTRGGATQAVSARVGIFHPFEGYGASDRPFSLSRPLFQTVAANHNGSTYFTPWNFDQSGLELAYARGRTSVAAAVFNGLVVLDDGGAFKAFPAAGGNLTRVTGFAGRNSKDVQLFVNQMLKDDGSGISGYYYYGAVDLPKPGTAPSAFAAGTSFNNRFYRAAVYGSWMLLPQVGVQGGYQWGRDHWYNTTTSDATGTFNSSGFFGEVYAPLTPNLTSGLRYDWFRPSTAAGDTSNARTAITLYANVPLNNGLQFIGEYQHATQKRPALSQLTDDKFQIRVIWIW